MSNLTADAAADVVVICDIGVVTPLGLGVPQTAANVRAGLSAAAAGDLFDAAGGRVVLAALPWSQLPAVTMPPTTPLREQELVRLASGAVTQALHGIPADHPPVPTWCAWPARDAGLPLSGERCAALLGPRLAVRESLRGGAAGVQAVALAATWVRAHGGVALVVAADSHLHPFILATLVRGKRVKTAQQPEGLIPGHGAAAVLLADSATVARRGLTWMATLGSCGFATDPHDEPRGDGLAMAIRHAVGDAGSPVRAWWTSMSGERAQAQEHSTAQIRTADRFAADVAVHHLAMNLGDTGAAAGLLAIAMAVSRAARPVLISSTADDAQRAAVLLV